MSNKVAVYRKEHFNAAHRLNNPVWSSEKNAAVFGKCNYANYHGHNYELFVTVKGNPSAETGFVIDLKQLSQLINEKVITPLDHKNINLDVDFMKGKLASTEILAIEIWEQLKQGIKEHGGELHSIRLHETENNFVEYFGDSVSNHPSNERGMFSQK